MSVRRPTPVTGNRHPSRPIEHRMTPAAGPQHWWRQLVRFGVLELRACAYPIVVLVAMAVTLVLPLPIARYDALLVVGVLATVAFVVLGLETLRETVAIAGFHVVGLVFEIVKVHLGSWRYPEPGMFMVAGVPLFAGFMYASVGSYIARAWRLFDLRVSAYRPLPVALICVGIYLNFFTHHWLPDLRVLLAILLIVACWGTWVHFTVGEVRYRMPLALSFLLIGGFLWLAENMATVMSAYRYPDQESGWTMVHVSKLGSWSLLVVISFALVALWKGSQLREETRAPRPAEVPLADLTSPTPAVATREPGLR